jgi:hypothetical protein
MATTTDVPANLIWRMRQAAGEAYDSIAKLRKMHDEFMASGGQDFIYPYYVEGGEFRTDLPVDYDGALAMASACEVISGKTEPSDVEGMQAKLLSYLAALARARV